MAINFREYRRAVRRGIRANRRGTGFIPMLLRPEYSPSPKYLNQKRDIYLERIGSGNFRKVEQRIWQRAKRIKKRVARGHRVVRAIYGPDPRI